MQGNNVTSAWVGEMSFSCTHMYIALLILKNTSNKMLKSLNHRKNVSKDASLKLDSYKAAKKSFIQEKIE